MAAQAQQVDKVAATVADEATSSAAVDASTSAAVASEVATAEVIVSLLLSRKRTWKQCPTQR